MIRLSSQQRQQIAHWFLPEQPGRLTAAHVLTTGNGGLFADRWPEPGAILAECNGSYVLASSAGTSCAFTVADLQEHIRGSVTAPDALLPHLKTAFPDMKIRQKSVFVLTQAPAATPAFGCELRPLTPVDIPLLVELSAQSQWITRSWGGPAGLAESGHACGALLNGRLAALACSFYLGTRHEDVAVTTEPGFRGCGFGAACSAVVCDEIRSRGMVPIWNASLDNPASLRVAEKLGFVHVRDYCVYSC